MVDDNAIGRLDRNDDREGRYSRMRPLQSPAAEDERLSPQGEAILSISSEGIIKWATAIFLFYAIVFAIAAWQDDELRLHFLDTTKRILQHTARIIGTWALRTEQHYNNTVDSLH